MPKGNVTRAILVSAAACLLALFLGAAVIHWRGRHLDGAPQEVDKAQIQSDQRPDYAIPNELLTALNNPIEFRVYRTVAEIPYSVRLAFAKAAGEKSFSMAGPNGAWESTDVIRDPQLPRRRLAGVAIGAQLCVLFYEHGGIGKNNNVAVFRMSEDHAEPIWHVYVASDVENPIALAKALREKNYQQGWFFWFLLPLPAPSHREIPPRDGRVSAGRNAAGVTAAVNASGR